MGFLLRVLSPSLLLAGLCLVFLTACSPAQKPPLRVGLNAWPGYEFIALAEQLGYYKDEGLDVKLIPYQTLADGRRGFEKGQFDVLAATLMEFYGTREFKGLDPVIFMVADFSNGGDMLLANKPIASVAELKGKKLGVEAGSIDVLTAANALASAKLGLKDVTLVNLPQPNLIKALLAGEIDAAQTYPPFAIEALAGPNTVKLFDTSQTPGAIIDVLFAKRSAMVGREADYAKFVRAFQRAVAYQRSNTEDANKRMAAREGISPAEFAQAMSGLTVVDGQQQAGYLVDGKIAALLTSTHQVLIELGLIKGPVCGPDCYTGAALK